MHAVWPWQYDRYLIPLLPWLLWLVAAGAGQKARWVLGILLALQSAFQTPHWLAGIETWRRPELIQTYSWLRGHTGPGDAIASAAPVRDGFYASRPSAPIPDTSDSAGFAATLRGRRIRFILWQDDIDVGLSARDSATIQRKLDRARGQLADVRLFQLIHEEPAERTRIYELQ
jgi:hypothetical protein